MKIALIGTGLMGTPMAERVLKAGHSLTVFNRTIEKAKPLEKMGAIIASTPKEAMAQARCTILVLTDAKAIEEVLATAPLKDKTIIQMGTIAPTESITFQKKITDFGGEYLECPVLGSKAEAADGKLILMVGSSKDQFKTWSDVLKIFGPQPRHIGEVGKAAAIKLALNQLIAAHAVSFSLSLGLIQKNEVDVNVFMDILRESSLFAPMFEKKLAKWLKRDYANPNFPVKHLLKDVELMIKEAGDKHLSTEGLEAIHQLLIQTKQKGLEDCDYSAVFNVINKI